MNYLPINLYFVLIFIFFQGFLILLVGYFFIDRFYSSRKARLEADTLRQSAYQQAQNTLVDAQSNAEKIIQSAHQQASDVITRANLLSDDLKNTFTNTLLDSLKKQQMTVDTVTTQLVSELKAGFSKEKISTLAGFDDLADDIKTEARAEIQNYGKVLASTTKDIITDFKETLSSTNDLVSQNMKNYEKILKDQLRARSIESIVALTKMFFDETTSRAEHEEIVMKILANENLKEKFGL